MHMRSALLAFTIAVLTVSDAFADPLLGLVNGSFESGDLTGWSLNIPLGPTADGLSLAPMGTGGVVQNLSETPYARGAFATASDGSYLAQLGTGQNAQDTEGTGIAELTLSQTISLDSGDTLSGLATFWSGDWGQDAAFVKIFDAAGALVAMPWSIAASWELYRKTTFWTPWDWIAPTAGVYTLALGVSTQGDNRLSTKAGFDGIKVTSVPEPSTLLLMAVAGVIFPVNRRLRPLPS
jgi:hypothetical protein